MDARARVSLRAGDRDAWNRVVADCWDRLLVTARSILRDRVAAEEAVEEAIERAWLARSRYDSDRPFFPWLSRILVNACRSRMRSRGVRRATAGDAVAAPTAEPSMIAKEEVRKILGALGSADGEVLRLYYIEQLGRIDISLIMGIPVGAVDQRLHRARAHARRDFGPRRHTR